MSATSAELFSMWKTGRRTLENTVEKINEENISHRLTPETNSVGFLLRHIAEAEHGFSHIAFKGPAITFERKTVGRDITDTGEHTNVDEIKQMFKESEMAIKNAFDNLTEEDWNEVIELRDGNLEQKGLCGLYPGAYQLSYRTDRIGYKIREIGITNS